MQSRNSYSSLSAIKKGSTETYERSGFMSKSIALNSDKINPIFSPNGKGLHITSKSNLSSSFNFAQMDQHQTPKMASYAIKNFITKKELKLVNH